jgi:hypothetical protein
LPDIDFNYDSQLAPDGEGFAVNDGNSVISGLYLRDLIRPIVAKQMDCLDLQDKLLEHTPEQIKFLSFAPFPDSGDQALVAMRIYGFNWPHRMQDIDERLLEITIYVSELLEVAEDRVDASFIELQHPSSTQRACWVRGKRPRPERT